MTTNRCVVSEKHIHKNEMKDTLRPCTAIEQRQIGIESHAWLQSRRGGIIDTSLAGLIVFAGVCAMLLCGVPS